MLLQLLVVAAVLLLVRRYFRGGRCHSKVRMDGKTVLITGCNTGIGKETAVDMCSRGARYVCTTNYDLVLVGTEQVKGQFNTIYFNSCRVLMACRSEERMKRAADEVLIRSKGSGSVALFKLDLSSMESIRRCAKQILQQEERIDVLINNAGVMMCPLTRTKEGLEMQIGTNHFGHFLFTSLLLERIKESAPARIVNVSSLAHEHGRIDLTDLNYERRAYGRVDAYGQSKLANVLFTKELARRLQGTGVTCYVLHPGAIDTELGRHVEEWLGPFKMITDVMFFPIR